MLKWPQRYAAPVEAGWDKVCSSPPSGGGIASSRCRANPLSVVKLTGRCRAKKLIDELVSKREQNDD